MYDVYRICVIYIYIYVNMESYLSYIHSICDRIYGILIEIDPPNHHALYQTRNTSSAPFPILLYPTDFQNIFHQHNYKALF